MQPIIRSGTVFAGMLHTPSSGYRSSRVSLTEELVRGRIHSVFRRRPVVATGFAVAVVIVAAVLSVQAFGWARWEVFGRRIDVASAMPAPAPTRFASWSFAFRDRAVSLRVPVSTAELDAAQGVDTRAMFRARGSLRKHYISRVVRVQSTSAFIRALSQQLRSVQRERGLDHDEYLELMVRCVQSLRYDTVEGRVRLPIEVVASGFGVCSEKALLLAALMVHEGYETGMWVFDSQNHVALAVGSDAAQFRESGYSFIETTRIAYVGEHDADYRASGPVARPPQFIALGGTRRYHAGYEVEYILRQLDQATRRCDTLEPYSRLATTAPAQLSDQYLRLASQGLAARSLARYIRGQTDEREAVFERLMRSAVEAAANEPSALVY